MNQGILGATQQVQGQTSLLALQEAKQKQAAEEQMMLAIQNDPALRERLFGGGSILGSLPTTGGPGGMPGAGPGPITQSPLGPGGGPTQTVPAYPDASRYANVPPQSGGPIPPGMAQQLQPQVTPPPGMPTLATLGGQPQGPQPGPQNPLLEMARRDPRAAMMLRQEMQQSQDRQWKLQDQQLNMGVKVAEFVARELQGVTDQASLDAARERVRQVHPQAAAQMPQMYSKEAVASVQQRGIAIAERAKNAKLEAEARRLDVETQYLPKMFEDENAPMPGQPAATTAAPTSGTQARTAPPEFDSAITEANRLYPQVSTTRIKSIIAAESNFDPKAVSSAGAQGPMQLMPSTAKDMGVDDPFNVQQNVRGGTRYYAQMLTKYGGDERKALTAYNWGPGNLDKVNGDVTKAPPETQAYVNRVLGGGGGTTGTTQAAAADPRIAPLEAQIALRTRQARQASLLGNESLSTRLNDDANRLTAEKNRLLEESRYQRERSEEISRAVARTTAETEERQRLERQRQAGPMLPEARRQLLTSLRTDIRAEPTFKVYQDVRNGYQNVRIGAESNSAQGDLAIINGLAKILDPSSAVMTGEAKNVEEAQGQLQRWFNSPQKFFEGDRLSTENRPRFLKMAHALAKEKLTTARTELTAVYGPLAKEGNIEFSQLLPMEDLKPLEPGPNVTALDELIKK